MSDDCLDFFNKEFFKVYNPEKHLFEKVNAAEKEASYSEAILYLDSILLINPNNRQAKQKLLETYPKAIQAVIDDGRYDDAFSIYKDAKKKWPELKSNISLSKTFYIKIHETVIEIKKIWNFVSKKTKLKIGNIVKGPGTIQVEPVVQPVGTSRGNSKISEKFTKKQFNATRLIIEPQYAYIYIKKNKVIVQCDFDVAIDLIDENGSAVKKNTILGQTSFSLNG